MQLAEVDELISFSARSSETPEAANRQGADFNMSGSLTESDLTAFLEHWYGGQSAADFNRDNVIDSDDVVEFMSRFVNP